MSRLIVKNLPKAITEQKIKDLFSQKGTITDVQLKYKDGKFRQFCFVGFAAEESAQEAVKFYDSTFIGTSKIKVEVCAVLGDESKPKSWSRYAKDSETYKKKNEKKESEEEAPAEEEPVAETTKKSKKAQKIDAIIGDHRQDPLFQEFMQSHAKDKLAWENDVGIAQDPNKQDTDNDSDEDEVEVQKLANKEISDIDYMKQLMGDKNQEAKPSYEKKSKKSKDDMAKLFTIKIRNVPKKIKREELIKFFRPSKAHSVRIPRTGGFAYVGFKLERDMQRALTKDKSFLKGKQIHVYDFTDKNFSADAGDKANQKQNPRWQEQQEQLQSEEAICESGKLFFRNLAYTVKEDDVQQLFEKYGTVVEINVPLDSITRKIKVNCEFFFRMVYLYSKVCIFFQGFGTVTFMMPEHAVLAYTELNGTMFHGRMFHVLPGKANDTKEDDNADGHDFKKKKQQELKKMAGSAHNWNTLFLGPNAVAEVMSKTYGHSKEDVLDSAKGGTNAAVRLALGETQIVLEMKQFLESHGVRPESFDEVSAKRSKTIILAKNLPAGTEVEELKEKFSQFGVLEKIILPPSGVTCLVKFEDPSEARKAFKKLAYSKFKHLPLYLEWAPDNAIKNEEVHAEEIKEDKQEKVEEAKRKDEPEAENLQEDDDEEDETPPEPNTTLFIKNLSFETEELRVREAFKHLGPIHTIQIAKKRNPDDPNKQIALGYGFIQFKKSVTTEKALKHMQFSDIDDKRIELKRSDRTLQVQAHAERKQKSKKTQKGSTKIMVKNIPFQAKPTEIRDIFKTFGELKAVRLPKKQGSDQHRGFGFIDFVNKSDAKNAFEGLHHSTHLYGRRLVLDWAEADQDVEEIRKRTAEQMGASEGDGKPKKLKRALLKDEDFIKFGSDDDE